MTEQRPELRCPGCNSDRVAAGRISATDGSCCFELPPQQSGFWGTFGPRVELDRPAYLCIECGLLWTQVDKRVAVEEIASGGNDALLDDLRLAGRRKRRWRWLLFGRR